MIERCRRRAGLRLICGLALLFLGARFAAAEVFTVEDVVVDATSEAAAEAREQALLDGQREALRRMVGRLVLRDQLAALAEPDDQTIANLVHNFQVEDEKASPVRYLARLTIRFKPDGVRDWLRRAGVGFAETPSKPVLVLPVYRLAGADSLWDEPNPWRDAWLALPERDGLVPMLLPLGDLTDMADISAAQASRGDAERLMAITQRYGAGDVLTALAEFVIDPLSNQQQLKVAVTRYGTAGQSQSSEKTFPLSPGRPAEEVFAEAARALAEEVEELWKRDNLLRFDEVNRIVVAVPIDFLEDWLEVRRRLDDVAFIRRRQLTYLSLTEARVELEFIGDERQLRLALAQSDLSLAAEGGRQVLQLSQFAQGSAE